MTAIALRTAPHQGLDQSSEFHALCNLASLFVLTRMAPHSTLCPAAPYIDDAATYAIHEPLQYLRVSLSHDAKLQTISRPPSSSFTGVAKPLDRFPRTHLLPAVVRLHFSQKRP